LEPSHADEAAVEMAERPNWE